MKIRMFYDSAEQRDTNHIKPGGKYKTAREERGRFVQTNV